MTRVGLGGKEDPINTIAFPTNETDESGAIWVVLEDGVPFKKDDWIAQGFTNFDVFVVGGEGGRGGTVVTNWVAWPIEHRADSFSAEQQAAYDTAHEIAAEPGGGMWIRYPFHHPGRHHYYVPRLSEPDDYDSVGFSGMSRDFVSSGYGQTSYSGPKFGGAGGGGGLFKRSGVLEELPSEVEVIVGKAGKRADPGHHDGRSDQALWIPKPVPFFPLQLFTFWHTGTDGVPVYSDGDQYYSGYRVDELNAALTILYNYDTVGTLHYGDWEGFERPKAGQDGGFSAFGDLAVASGGKGGGPAYLLGPERSDQPGFHELLPSALGGQGGIGGRSEAGGGAAGATASTNAEDGNWNGQVGEGGGGGRYSPGNNISTAYGGRGSYGFDDPSVAGPRGLPDQVYPYQRIYDPNTGELVSETKMNVITMPLANTQWPGQGGGIGLAAGRLKFGSSAQKGIGNGAVIVRLSTAI